MNPRVYVDFNEMPDEDEVLLSKEDTKLDSDGCIVKFVEGLAVAVYMDDEDEFGNPSNLIADGVAVRNTHGGWTSAARWLLKIDDRGIRRDT